MNCPGCNEPLTSVVVQDMPGVDEEAQGASAQCECGWAGQVPLRAALKIQKDREQEAEKNSASAAREAEELARKKQRRETPPPSRTADVPRGPQSGNDDPGGKNKDAKKDN